jgi:hypothetical protein
MISGIHLMAHPFILHFLALNIHMANPQRARLDIGRLALVAKVPGCSVMVLACLPASPSSQRREAGYHH